METNQTKQIDYLNSIQVFGAFCVVLIHTCSGVLDCSGVVGEANNFIYNLFKHLGEIAVPLFIMKSGALLLNPSKQISFHGAVYKYCKRIVLALLVFGLPMCFLEQAFNYRNGSVGISEMVWNSIIDFIRGHSWGHMWYLYMLITLYLMTPIIKVFINNTTKSFLERSIIIIFIFSSVLPTINSYLLDLDGYYTFHGSYLFLYILGYYIHQYFDAKSSQRVALIIALTTCLIIICKIVLKIDFNSWYHDSFLILFAASIFCLFKSRDVNIGRLSFIAKYSFGIYIIHPVFINIVYKFFGFNPSVYFDAWWSVPLFCFGFFGCSLLSSYILHQIKPLSKNVL